MIHEEMNDISQMSEKIRNFKMLILIKAINTQRNGLFS